MSKTRSRRTTGAASASSSRLIRRRRRPVERPRRRACQPRGPERSRARVVGRHSAGKRDPTGSSVRRRAFQGTSSIVHFTGLRPRAGVASGSSARPIPELALAMPHAFQARGCAQARAALRAAARDRDCLLRTQLLLRGRLATAPIPHAILTPVARAARHLRHQYLQCRATRLSASSCLPERGLGSNPCCVARSARAARSSAPLMTCRPSSPLHPR